MTWEEDRVAEEPTVPERLHHWVIETADIMVQLGLPQTHIEQV